MSFSQQNGYIPRTAQEIMSGVREEINSQFGTAYTEENFLGTNFYKYFYGLVQEMQKSEIKTSEIFLKLQQYIRLINLKIDRPKVTNPGMLDKMEREGFIASLKPMIDGDAGKIHLCVALDEGIHARGAITISNFANLVSGTADTITIGVTTFTAQAGAATQGDATFQAATSNAATATSLAAQINAHATAGSLVKARRILDKVEIVAIEGGADGNDIALSYTDNDTNVGASVSDSFLEGGEDNPDYSSQRDELFDLISQVAIAGALTQGNQSKSIVLSNGQSFDFKFNLPNRRPLGLRLTLTLSENNQLEIGNPDATKSKLLTNIAERYRLGNDFEPQKYFAISDAPWCSKIKLEYTYDVVMGEIQESAVWETDIISASYDDLFNFDMARLILVEE